MKSSNYILLLAPLLFFFLSCDDTSKNKAKDAQITTLDVKRGDYYNATVSGQISGLENVAIDFECGIEFSFNESFDEENTFRFITDKKYTEGIYTVNAFPLESKHTYYYRAYYINQLLIYYGDIKQFSFEWDKPMLTGTWAASDGNNYTIKEDHTGLRDNTQGNVLEFTWKILGNELILNYATNRIIRYRIISINENSINVTDVNDINQTTISFYRFVDLGLSVKWATCNVGAEKPEEYGEYYAWGEIEEKSDYSWNTYKWCTGSYNTITKYADILNNAHFDKTTLDLDDDIAHAKLGGNWRMPSKAEIEELVNNSSYIWTALNDIDGYLITSNKPGFEDRSVFFPGAGCKSGDNYGDYGSCYYWSSSVYKTADSHAYSLEYTAFYGREYTRERNIGLTIRPVCP